MSTTFDQEADAYAWINEHMPREEAQALAQFCAINPRMRGIPWWDAMSMLRDSDAHLDVVESMAEIVKEDGDEWTMLHTFVTYTLLYASRLFSVDMNNIERVFALRATIANNGRGAQQ